MKNVFQFTAEVWEYGGEASWHFVTLPKDIAVVLQQTTEKRPGFGSIKVLVIIKHKKWLTSLFPDSKSNSYLLPIKKAVRQSLGIHAGDTVSVAFSPM